MFLADLRIGLLLVLVSVTGCRPAPDPGQPPPMPGSIVALDARQREISPCSREGPGPIDSTWTPTLAQVRALEAGLPAYAAAAAWREPGHGPTRPLREFVARYAGFYQGERRWIYASFEPVKLADNRSHDDAPLAIWCDGGADFFGVEYAPDTGEFRRLRRNSQSYVKGRDPRVLPRRREPPQEPLPLGTP